MRSFGSRFLAGLALAGALAFGGAAPAATLVATPIGGLFFEHDPAVWTAEAADDTAIISCIVKDCGFATVEVFFAPSAERCDEMAALDAAEVAFPDRTSRGVNMHDLNGLAVYVARSGIPTPVYDPDAGDAVYACLDRDGVRYEFLTRIGERPIVRGDEWHVFSVLAALSAPPAPITTISLGGLQLAYPADRWTPSAAMTANGPATLFCLPPLCEGYVPLTIEVAKAADPGASCLPADVVPPIEREFFDPDVTTIATADGQLTLEFVTVHSSCRAWTPPQYGACVIHDGMRYSFWTGWDTGCHFGPEIGEGAFLDLVQSLRPVTAP